VRGRTAGVGAVLVLLAGGVLGVGGGETARTGRNGLIVFASDRASPTAQIHSVTATGHDRRRLQPSDEETRIPSPDGSRIAYTVDGLIFTVRLDGRGRRRLGLGDDPSWAPDSRRLAFFRLVEESPNGSWPHVFVADALTGRVRASLRSQLD
jgi:Tol biopolymer transport system component